MNNLELLKIRTKLGKTQEEFALLAGVSPRTVQNWEAGKAIPKSKHAFLRGLLEKNNTEYSSNNSTTFNVINEPSEIYHNTNGNKFIELKNGKFKIIVKKVPVKAFGSYLSDFQNVEFIEDLEEVSFTVDHIGKGKYMCFEVEGDSMNGGNLNDSPDGAELLCRELGKQHWKDGFRDSLYGWVIVHKQTVLFKDIISMNFETGDIICHSRSGLPNHSDFTINLNDVHQILKVIKRTF
jgi:DNA-binding XRE family transcriptional regulator